MRSHDPARLIWLHAFFLSSFALRLVCFLRQLSPRRTSAGEQCHYGRSADAAREDDGRAHALGRDGHQGAILHIRALFLCFLVPYEHEQTWQWHTSGRSSGDSSWLTSGHFWTVLPLTLSVYEVKAFSRHSHLLNADNYTISLISTGL